MEKISREDMCRYCTFRSSWECDDGYATRLCSEFRLNWDALDNDSRKEIIDLMVRDDSNHYYYY